jgi:hypothetical protein
VAVVEHDDGLSGCGGYILYVSDTKMKKELPQRHRGTGILNKRFIDCCIKHTPTPLERGLLN